MNTFRDISKELERRIRAGVYQPETPLPPRLELVREFEVARATVDRAIRALERSGYLSSRRGSGTFVNAFPASSARVALVGSVLENECEGCSLRLTTLGGEPFVHRSEWKRLLDFDGVIWMRPGRELLPAIEHFRGVRPQAVVNRTEPDGVLRVTTDHRGALREITRERLAALPEARPAFLRSPEDSPPVVYRFEGFLDACREAGRFYEEWVMPADFEQRVAELRRRARDLAAPRLLVADSRFHTGSVMRLGAELGWRWGEDTFYSDFDNDYGCDVWGCTVTSFLQDQHRLLLVASERLRHLIETGGEDDSKLLIPPIRRRGDT